MLAAAIARYALRAEDFASVIDGMQMDAEQVIVAPDLATFDLYCDRAASAVGRLSVRAFGDSSAKADEVAYHLGRALQITNILRDIAEDAGRGRLYLPREVLDEAGVPRDPDGALHAPTLPAACRSLAVRAQSHFRLARTAMAACDKKAMRPARLMDASYSAVLWALIAADWQTPMQRVSAPRWRKALIGLRALVPV